MIRPPDYDEVRRAVTGKKPLHCYKKGDFGCQWRVAVQGGTKEDTAPLCEECPWRFWLVGMPVPD